MNQEATPPFIRDDELVVRCSHSGCNRTTAVETIVDSKEATGGDNRWRVSFITAADGRLEVDTVECPDHRVSDAIDELADAQRTYAKELAKSQRVADELTE